MMRRQPKLVYPEEADITQLRVSVMAPIRAALLGLAEGASFQLDAWENQRRMLTILTVISRHWRTAGARLKTTRLTGNILAVSHPSNADWQTCYEQAGIRAFQNLIELKIPLKAVQVAQT